MESYPEKQKRMFAARSEMAGSWVICFAIARGVMGGDPETGTIGIGVLIAISIFLCWFWSHKAECWGQRGAELSQLAAKRSEEERSNLL